MKTFALALLAVGALPAAADSQNPLGKVIELMDSLYAKVVAQGEAEDKAYREYTDWCDDAANNKRNDIKTNEAKKEDLEASIGKLESDISTSESKIEELAASIATQTKDLDDATLIREKEAAEFGKNEAELMDAIDTLGRAVSIISKEMSKNPAAFTQVDTSNFKNLMKGLSAIMDAASFSSASKQKLASLVQASQQDKEEDQEDPSGAPAATVYKSHSSDILDLLEDLKEKAEEDLAALRKAETNAKQNYDMLKQSLTDANKNDNKDMADEKAAKAAAEEEKAADTSDLGMTVKALADANSVLATVKSDCMQVAADHETTVGGRNEELKVIAEAKKILLDTSSGAVQQSYSFVQLSAAGSMMRTSADLKKAEVITMVQQLAKKYHSNSLAQLASRIQAVVRLGSSAGEDPFVKVKGLIKDLIAKLEAEASAAAEEKAYCDDQMAKTEEKKSELEEDISALTAKIDKAAAKSAQLKQEVKDLSAELAALAKLQAEMDSVRSDENAAYNKAKSELTLGLKGVRDALSVLREYYGGAAASMLQEGDDQPAKPILHSKAEGAGSSIIGILEVVESDFAKSLAQEEAEESDSQAEYDKTTQENEVTKTMKSQDVVYKVKEFKGLDKAVAEMTSDRAGKDTQLKAVLDYYAKVKDRCIAKPESYEERKARREAEIAGLKEALDVLENETALVQLRSRKHGSQAQFLGL
jgi:septal ring factor EnvC (AmiA/AmiB activator)